MAKITSLFNLDISQIRHDGAEVRLIKLNGDVVYRKTSQSYGIYVPYQFRDDSSITEVDVIVNESHTDLSYMFRNCGNLTYANAEDWDTSNVTNMSYMFYNCDDLTSLDVSNWDTSNVTNMSYMFYYTNLDLLESLDFSAFNTSKVSNMSYMFAYNSPVDYYGVPIKLETLDISSFNTSNVSNMMNMFHSFNVRRLNLSNFITYGVTNMARMFCGCSELIVLNLSNFKIYSDTNVNWMLQGCNNLHTLRLNNCDNTTIKKIIESLDFPTGTMNPARTIYCKEENAKGLTLPVSWRFSYIKDYTIGEFKDDTEIKNTYNIVVNDSHTDLSEMFSGCTSLVSVNVDGWDTSNVTSMYRMFYDCDSVQSVNLSSLDTSNVTSMRGMFGYCDSLTTVNLSNLDTSKVTNIDSMFAGCKKLITVDLSNCDIGNVSSVIFVFSSCYELTNLKAPKNIRCNLSLKDCEKLTHDSLMNVINNLATVTSTKTLTLGETNLAKLSEKEKAIATNKGWTLA